MARAATGLPPRWDSRREAAVARGEAGRDESRPYNVSMAGRTTPATPHLK
ncbi:MAG TPA: hypothetical protein VF613_18290 [Longimicrobium sp.]